MVEGDDRIDASRPARGRREGIYETACSFTLAEIDQVSGKPLAEGSTGLAKP